MKKKVITGLSVLLILLVGGLAMAQIAQKNHWAKQDLTGFTVSESGDMRGSEKSTSLNACGEKALLTERSVKEHGESPEVKEYLISGETFQEVKEVFLSEGMYRWEGKKFSKRFVADGSSTRYSFFFSEDDLGFSSQIYPEKYSRKLEKIDRVIEKYSVDREELPGLSLKEGTEGEEASLTVTEYSENRLYYRVSNVTEKEVNTGEVQLLKENGTPVPFLEEDSLIPETCIPGGTEEGSIRPGERLPAGTYTLITGPFRCVFEIR